MILIHLSIEFFQLLVGYLDWKRIKRELSDTEDYLNNLRIEEINIEIMADFLRRFVEYFEKMETGQRRLLIQAIVKEAIVYDHEDIRLRLALPIFRDGDTPPNGNGNGGDRGFPPNGVIPPQNKKGNLSASSYPFYPNWLRLWDRGSKNSSRWSSIYTCHRPIEGLTLN